MALFVCGCVCVYLRKKKMRRGEITEFVVHKEERKKKRCEREINKIIRYTSIVTMHICMVTIANV